MQIELEFENAVFSEKRGKPEYPGKTFQSKDDNLLSPLRHSCSPTQ